MVIGDAVILVLLINNGLDNHFGTGEVVVLFTIFKLIAWVMVKFLMIK